MLENLASSDTRIVYGIESRHRILESNFRIEKDFQKAVGDTGEIPISVRLSEIESNIAEMNKKLDVLINEFLNSKAE